MADPNAQLGAIPVFSELSKSELKEIAKLMTRADIPSGTVLTRQGEPGQEFMVICEGTARVQINDETVAHLGAGDFVGELAVISGTPRSATVTATSDMTLEVLTRQEFMSLLDTSPDVSHKILVAAVKRLQRNERTRTN